MNYEGINVNLTGETKFMKLYLFIFVLFCFSCNVSADGFPYLPSVGPWKYVTYEMVCPRYALLENAPESQTESDAISIGAQEGYTSEPLGYAKYTTCGRSYPSLSVNGVTLR